MIGSVTNLYHISHANPEKAMEKACKEFESIFTHQLLKTMGESIPGGIFEDESGLAGNFYKDMLYMTIADSVSESGGFGLSEILMRKMKGLGDGHE